MFIEVRNIFLRWFFYNFFNVLGFVNRVMYHPCVPSIPPFRPRQIHRVTTLFLTHKHTILQIDSINPCTPLDEARSIVALHDGHRFRTAATRAHKDDYTHTQYPHESR